MDTNKLVQNLVDDAKPVKRLPSLSARFSMWLAPAGIFCAIGVGIMGVRDDITAKFFTPFFFAETIFLFILALWASHDALQFSVPGSERRGWRRWASLIAGGGWALSLGYRLSDHYIAENRQAFIPDTEFVCSIGILLMSLIPSVLLFWTFRRAFPLSPRNVGFLAAVGNAALAAFGMQFICAHDRPTHLILWHLIPVALLAALGGLITANIFRKNKKAGGGS